MLVKRKPPSTWLPRKSNPAQSRPILPLQIQFRLLDLHFFDKRQQGVLSALLPFFSAHNFQLGVRIFPIHYPANCLYFLSLNLLPTSHSLYFQSWYYLQVSLSLPSEVTIAAIIDSQASSFLLSQTHSLFKVFPGMGNESLKLDFKLLTSRRDARDTMVILTITVFNGG